VEFLNGIKLLDIFLCVLNWGEQILFWKYSLFKCSWDFHIYKTLLMYMHGWETTPQYLPQILGTNFKSISCPLNHFLYCSSEYYTMLGLPWIYHSKMWREVSGIKWSNLVNVYKVDLSCHSSIKFFWTFNKIFP